MPGRTVREVEAEAALVSVARDLSDHLAEAERDDGEVVPAQPQRRQADDDPAKAVMAAPMSKTSQMEMWMPPTPGKTPTAPKLMSMLGSPVAKSGRAKCGDANHAAQ